MLWMNAFTCLVICIVYVFIEPPFGDTLSVGTAILYAMLYALERFVIEGVALLLMEKGMGLHSAKRCLLKAFVWAIFSFTLFFFFYMYPSVSFQLAVAWNVVVCIFYGVLWLAPSTKLFRRPAAINYAIFWLFAQLISLSSVLMYNYPSTAAVGNCTFAFGVVLLHSFCEPVVVYRTLLRDCRYVVLKLYHGIYILFLCKKSSIIQKSKLVEKLFTVHSIVCQTVNI